MINQLAPSSTHMNSFLPKRLRYSTFGARCCGKFICLVLILVALLLPPKVASATSLPDTTSEQGFTTIFLPIIVAQPTVLPYLFRTSDSCTGDSFSEIQLSNATFNFGFKRLSYGVLIQGGIGRQWSQTWTIDGEPQPDLSRSGVITQEEELFTSSIVYGENGQCGDAIPAGTWTVTFMIDGVVMQTGSVVIK